MVRAYAASAPGQAFEPFDFTFGALDHDQIEIDVETCGICHSDLSMLDNDWGMTQYPFVGGHEVVGRIARLGERAQGLKVGDRVGLGWFSSSCMHCDLCLGGRHNLCSSGEGTIIGRHGGFADKVRCHWAWATPIPDGLDARNLGPLFCGGITVFTPLVMHQITALDRVGVIGIGGLGHLALRFAHHWGCEVTAFSTSADKADQARDMGADDFVDVSQTGALERQAGRFDLIINTTNASLDWDAYLNALAPDGVLHTVGAVTDAFGASNAFPLIMGRRRIAGSPVGNPVDMRDMLAFCARKRIEPITEHLPLANINDAFEKLRSGRPRYRLVLDVT